MVCGQERLRILGSKAKKPLNRHLTYSQYMVSQVRKYGERYLEQMNLRLPYNILSQIEPRWGCLMDL